jgi:group I intron endonuclease
LNKIKWKRFIEDPSIILTNKAAIYIYQSIINNNKIYLGSTCNIAERVKQHRYSVNNGGKTCPKFYNYIRKYGWDNLRLGILEYLSISKFKGKRNIKKAILDKEQYYLDMLNPNLNINKTAGSTLGYKH